MCSQPHVKKESDVGIYNFINNFYELLFHHEYISSSFFVLIMQVIANKQSNFFSGKNVRPGRAASSRKEIVSNISAYMACVNESKKENNKTGGQNNVSSEI